MVALPEEVGGDICQASLVCTQHGRYLHVASYLTPTEACVAGVVTVPADVRKPRFHWAEELAVNSVAGVECKPLGCKARSSHGVT